jgi:WXG100 family type VII secretion target
MADQTSFVVVPAAVSDTGRFVQDTASALRSGVRSADTEIASLLTTWKGGAADTYAAGWEETKAGALEVLDALATMADLLGVTATGFTDLDQRRAADTTTYTSSLNLP